MRVLRFVRQAVVAHLERRVSLEDCPHGANFMVQRWLAYGTPEVAAVDHDHAVVDASPLQLWRDQRRHIAWISGLVRLVLLSPKTEELTPVPDTTAQISSLACVPCALSCCSHSNPARAFALTDENTHCMDIWHLAT